MNKHYGRCKMDYKCNKNLLHIELDILNIFLINNININKKLKNKVRESRVKKLKIRSSVIFIDFVYYYFYELHSYY